MKGSIRHHEKVWRNIMILEHVADYLGVVPPPENPARQGPHYTKHVAG